MIIKVHMLAFMNGEIRLVTIPGPNDPNDTQEILNQTWNFGQNDFQPQRDRASVSVGDVAELIVDGQPQYWRMQPSGFLQLTPEQFKLYKHVPRRDRQFVKFENS